MNSLYAMIDMSKITTRSKLLFIRSNSTSIYPLQLIRDTSLQFGHVQFDSSNLSIIMVTLNESLSTLIDGGVNNINSPTIYGNNGTGNVASSGLVIRLVY